ncbi:MAG: type II toxin-antitoxin system RelE/ParE family toxin, partial [Cyclonatronaceae bacterium]
MPVSLILTEKAEKDLDDAYHWYEKQEPGLGKQVIRCIDAKIANINRHPLHHPVVQNENVRRALVNRFPYPSPRRLNLGRYRLCNRSQ